MDLAAFIKKWKRSGASERANAQPFLLELCEVLGVPKPDPATGNPDADLYVFEKDVRLTDHTGAHTVGFADLYKHGCFILEAKQGSDPGTKKRGSARRQHAEWSLAMQIARGQAIGYAKALAEPPPFIIVCDVAHCFELYASFDGTSLYRPFPAPLLNRIDFDTLAAHVDTLRGIFTEPLTLDPSQHATRITTDVAGRLGRLAARLENAGNNPTVVARFLMRCIFTMFAEDIGLLPNRVFEEGLKHWVKNPDAFQPALVGLWSAMNDGHSFGVVGRLLRFNGGLFRDSTTLPLNGEDLELLLDAARCDWKDVEPAIFGTLLERALDKRERHKLGAHFTPREYVERLVHHAIDVPLRAEWDGVQAEARRHVANGALDKATAAVRSFLEKLRRLIVLDPACGSGNFLYVALDQFKQLEGEVRESLAGFTNKQLEFDVDDVNPSQFLGIEVKPWAKEITELVLWIGYLQHRWRMGRGGLKLPEPILRDYGNIECRDAVVGYDERVARLTAGQPLDRWDGETRKVHPGTGALVPDERFTARVYDFVGPKPAEWPHADFVVGNPPFVGNKRMRKVLGEGYVDALREAYPSVPDSADYVMYWWHKAAKLVSKHGIRFGFITTNSITQAFARRVVSQHIGPENGSHIAFAIPDHPWVDSATSASVRVAMTVVAPGDDEGVLATLRSEDGRDLDQRRGRIGADLQIVQDAPTVAVTVALESNRGLASRGITRVGEGFLVHERSPLWSSKASRELLTPDRIKKGGPQRRALDFFGKSEEEVRHDFPDEYQHLLDRVRPFRVAQSRPSYAKYWWIFAEPREQHRRATSSLDRYIVTIESSPHRWFTFVPPESLPEQSLVAIALDDPFYLGILSSRVHVAWCLRRGSRLGVGNDPRYTISLCFDAFPFPQRPTANERTISDLALEIEETRRKALERGFSITKVYNVIAKRRAGEQLTLREQPVYEKGLAGILFQLHSDLDEAALRAYGWPPDIADAQIIERLALMNVERAAEERSGVVRWLRPDFQNTAGAAAARQAAAAEQLRPIVSSARSLNWPATVPEQIAVMRATLSDGHWRTVEELTAEFAGASSIEAVQLALQSLEALGLAVSTNGSSARRWRSAERVDRLASTTPPSPDSQKTGN